jgi:hypothetical protein
VAAHAREDRGGRPGVVPHVAVGVADPEVKNLLLRLAVADERTLEAAELGSVDHFLTLGGGEDAP